MLLKSKRDPSTSASAAPESKPIGDDIFKNEPTSSLIGGTIRPKKHHVAHQLHQFTISATPTTVVTTAAAHQQPQPGGSGLGGNAAKPGKVFTDYDWDVVDEYDPLWPNEYEKLVKDRRDKGGGSDNNSKQSGHHHRGYHHGSGADHHRPGGYKRRGGGIFGSSGRFEAPDAGSSAAKQQSGFGGRPVVDGDDPEDSRTTAGGGGGGGSSGAGGPRTTGAAIAPPPSLQESTVIIPAFAAGGKDAAAAAFGASSVAAKIMAKYGFRDGQGLGKQEQGMSMALQVEKTSKRGGRIIHERESGNGSPEPRDDDAASPPPPSSSSQTTPAAASSPQLMLPPPPMMPGVAASANKTSTATTSSPASTSTASTAGDEPSITEIMKAPSKVVLLRNMVGPGDVDNDLEPEVKDECNTKYGDVISVVINELKNVVPEEAVRIFVEFRRIESAIKGQLNACGMDC